VEAPIIIYYKLFEDRVEILRFWPRSHNPQQFVIELKQLAF